MQLQKEKKASRTNCLSRVTERWKIIRSVLLTKRSSRVQNSVHRYLCKEKGKKTNTYIHTYIFASICIKKHWWQWFPGFQTCLHLAITWGGSKTHNPRECNLICLGYHLGFGIFKIPRWLPWQTMLGTTVITIQKILTEVAIGARGIRSGSQSFHGNILNKVLNHVPYSEF